MQRGGDTISGCIAMYSDTLYNVVSLYRDIFLCPHVHVCIQYQYKNYTTIHRCIVYQFCMDTRYNGVFRASTWTSHGPTMPSAHPRTLPDIPGDTIEVIYTAYLLTWGGTWRYVADTCPYSSVFDTSLIHYTSVLLPYTAEKAIHHRSIVAAHVTAGPY